MAPKIPAHFRRYTGLSALIHMLQTREITLLNPATWDDGNDAYFMSEYKRLKDLKSLLAICLAQCSETYHHWRVFSSGPDGVCIEFRREKLIDGLVKFDGVVARDVTYWTIDDLRDKDTIAVDDLPFMKRFPYQDEKEFRFVFESKDEARDSAGFPIEISWISRITLSPWMSYALRDSVTKTLRAIPGCEKLPVSRSTLVSNSEWQSQTEKAR